ncbi:MAG: cytochrome o ubiquinol oxidase subunit III [Pseudomonadota bacterium]
MSNTPAASLAVGIDPETGREYQFLVTEDEGHHDDGGIFGFWLYLMTDSLIFAVLFAVHAVVGQGYAAGPAPRDLFEIDMILLATFMLLFSSITYGFAMLRMHANDLRGTMIWLTVTGLFGLGFLFLEFREFAHLSHIGAVPTESAFLSSFWILVGTHGLHVTAGCIWLAVLMGQLYYKGLTPANVGRVTCLSMFWHFLDLIWIGVFSFVYLAGVVQ